MLKSVIFLNENIESKYVNKIKYRKVKDRFHYTGENRFAAHGIFNLNIMRVKNLI